MPGLRIMPCYNTKCYKELRVKMYTVQCYSGVVNGSQLAKMKKSIPDIFLPWSL